MSSPVRSVRRRLLSDEYSPHPVYAAWLILPCGSDWSVQYPVRIRGGDLPPRTSPPSKLDPGPFEVHSKGSGPVPATWGVGPLAPEADRPRRCEADAGCVLPAPSLGQYLRLPQRVEDLHIQQFIPEFSIEALHIPIAQSEPGIEPNGASNDFRWKAVTFEGDGVHPKRLHRNHQDRD